MAQGLATSPVARLKDSIHSSEGSHDRVEGRTKIGIVDAPIQPQSFPLQGVLLHAIGGLAAASFYIPYKKVRHWAWENYWLVGGFVSWIIAPWVLAMLIVPQTPAILAQASVKTISWTVLFGAVWGIGGLTFGLTMRFLGVALGYAIALGLTAVFGTLLPPLFSGELFEIAQTTSGQVLLSGVVVCIVGIVLGGTAGRRKEAELSDEQKQASIAEFNFAKGLIVAIVAGVMSASMAVAFVAGKPIAKLAIHNGAPPLWQNLPVLIVILFGGFVTNFLWCATLIIKNGTVGELIGNRSSNQALAPSINRPRLSLNYILCVIAGVTWYLQFFFYGMGTTQLGKYDFSSWTLHMAFIIIFSTLWGLALREWSGASRVTHAWNAVGLIVLILSIVIIGWGNTLAGGA
jgi:L-rhamnose-H+ transport protein